MVSLFIGRQAITITRAMNPTPTPPVIQILIPTYNVEKYLHELFESLSAQTYEHWQAIFVNDASTDSSGEILDKWANQDARIRVIHLTQNRGVSHARNVALGEVTAPFFCFVDSDDRLHPQHLELMLQRAEETGADLVQTGIVFFDDLTDKTRTPPMVFGRSTFSSKRLLTQMCFDRRVGSFLWQFLYRSATFCNLPTFPVGHNYEDIRVIPTWIERASLIASTGFSTYYYRQVHNSIIHTKSIKNIQDHLEAIRVRSQYIATSPLFSGFARFLLRSVHRGICYQILQSTLALPDGPEKAIVKQEAEQTLRSFGGFPHYGIPEKWVIKWHIVQRAITELLLFGSV